MVPWTSSEASSSSVLSPKGLDFGVFSGLAFDVMFRDVAVLTEVPETDAPAGRPLSYQIVTPPDRKGVIPYRITISFSRHLICFTLQIFSRYSALTSGQVFGLLPSVSEISISVNPQICGFSSSRHWLRSAISVQSQQQHGTSSTITFNIFMSSPQKHRAVLRRPDV